MSGLKKLTATCNRIVKSKAIGYIFHIDNDIQEKLLKKIKTANAIIFNCRLGKTRAEIFRFLEKELEMEHDHAMDKRLARLKNKISESERFIVFYNAETLTDMDYKIIENFNEVGAPIIFISTAKRYYEIMQMTKTYQTKAIIEHDFKELN